MFTGIEKEEIVNILKFMRENKTISEYIINASKDTIYIRVGEEFIDDEEFLKFKVAMSIILVSPRLEDTLIVKVF